MKNLPATRRRRNSTRRSAICACGDCPRCDDAYAAALARSLGLGLDAEMDAAVETLAARPDALDRLPELARAIEAEGARAALDRLPAPPALRWDVAHFPTSPNRPWTACRWTQGDCYVLGTFALRSAAEAACRDDAASPAEVEPTGPTADDDLWHAADRANAEGLAAGEDERTAIELWTVSALDWFLDSVPDAQWDRWAEERQSEW